MCVVPYSPIFLKGDMRYGVAKGCEGGGENQRINTLASDVKATVLLSFYKYKTCKLIA